MTCNRIEEFVAADLALSLIRVAIQLLNLKPQTTGAGFRTTNFVFIQIDSYEYLHSAGWVHKDLKGSNLLFSLQGPSDGKVFLVDYGLVSRLTR